MGIVAWKFGSIDLYGRRTVIELHVLDGHQAMALSLRAGGNMRVNCKGFQAPTSSRGPNRNATSVLPLHDIQVFLPMCLYCTRIQCCEWPSRSNLEGAGRTFPDHLNLPEPTIASSSLHIHQLSKNDFRIGRVVSKCSAIVSPTTTSTESCSKHS